MTGPNAAPPPPNPDPEAFGSFSGTSLDPEATQPIPVVTPEAVGEARVSWFDVARAGLSSVALNRRLRHRENREDTQQKRVDKLEQKHDELEVAPLTASWWRRRQHANEMRGKLRRLQTAENHVKEITWDEHSENPAGRVADFRIWLRRSRRQREAAEIADPDARRKAIEATERRTVMLPPHSTHGHNWPEGNRTRELPGARSANNEETFLWNSTYEVGSLADLNSMAEQLRADGVQGIYHNPAKDEAQQHVRHAAHLHNTAKTLDAILEEERKIALNGLTDRQLLSLPELNRRRDRTDQMARRASDARANYKDLRDTRRQQRAAAQAAWEAAWRARAAKSPRGGGKPNSA